jgi:DNA helicase-2/ATP-dependent DNA helicase PcrA
MFYADLHVHSKYSLATSRDCDLEHMALWAGRKGIAVVGTGDITHPAWLQEIEEKLTAAEPGLYRLRPGIEKQVRQLARSSFIPHPSSFPLPRFILQNVGCVKHTGDTDIGAFHAPYFMLQAEVSTVYKKDGRTRKVHQLIYVPDFAIARRLIRGLSKIGKLSSDGRPTLALDSRDLLEIVLSLGKGCYLIPAHIWTPWFGILGSKSGFDSIEECFGDLTSEIFAVETGLSADPATNWRLSSLDRYTSVSNSDAHSPSKLGREATIFDTKIDYFSIFCAIMSGKGFRGTVVFFPEEGRYHHDGHRKCGVCLTPEETRRCGGKCPVCGKPLTLGVMHRVNELADRPEIVGCVNHADKVNLDRPHPNPLPKGEGTDSQNLLPRAAPFRSLIPLVEVLSEIYKVGPHSKFIKQKYEELLARVGPELFILEQAPIEEIKRSQAEPGNENNKDSSLLAEAILRMRAGKVVCRPGFDGEYGVVRLFMDKELREIKK